MKSEKLEVVRGSGNVFSDLYERIKRLKTSTAA